MATQELITEETIEKTTKTTIRTVEDVTMPPELVIIDKQAYCTSLQIAKHFEKEHKHVLRDIENAILQVQAADNPEMQAAQMFVKGFDEEPNNLGFKVKRPMYHLNRDGFTFLVMSYNGVKAAKFKLVYMSAFNKMEALLMQPQEVPVIDKCQYDNLSARIHDAVTRTLCSAGHVQKITDLLRIRFNINKLEQMPRIHYTAALEEVDRIKREVNPMRHALIEAENEHFNDVIAMKAPSIQGLRLKLTRQLGKTAAATDIRALVARAYLAEQGLLPQ